MNYRQRDIVEFNVELNDGKMIPVLGLVISDNSRMENFGNPVTVFRVSKDISAFNPAYHRMLEESFMQNPLETQAYLTTGMESFYDWGKRITKVVNRMSYEEFERTLAWATGLIGHKWLWIASPIV